MGWIKLFLVVALALVSYHWWQKHQAGGVVQSMLQPANESGFVDIPPPVGLSRTAVLIFSPPNCPSAEAQQARVLSRALAELGIPHLITSQANFDLDSPEAVRAVKRVMEGQGPVVLVHGRGKGNPTLDEVVAEYRTQR